MKMKTLADFQICINVPLKHFQITYVCRGFMAFKWQITDVLNILPCYKIRVSLFWWTLSQSILNFLKMPWLLNFVQTQEILHLNLNFTIN